MINYNIIPQAVCEMRNVKPYSNMFKAMQQFLATTEFACNLTTSISLLLVIQILSDLISKRPTFFVVFLFAFFVEFEQVFDKIFFT